MSEIDPNSITGIPPTLRRMRAVKDQKLKLELLGKGFTSRANDYLESSFKGVTDQVLRRISTLNSPTGMPKLDDIGPEIRSWRDKNAPLLQSMYFLNKESIASFGQNYCSTMNNIIRLEPFLSGGRRRDVGAGLELESF